MTPLERKGWALSAVQALSLPGRTLVKGGSCGRILFALVERAGDIVPKEVLRSAATNGVEKCAAGSIDVYLCHLREALADLGFSQAIVTFKGQGVSIPKSIAAEIDALVRAQP